MAFTRTTETGASRAVTTSDDEAFIVFTHATPELDLQNEATRSWAAGTVISGVTTTGPLTINPNTDVSINGSTSSVVVPQRAAFTLTLIATDSWQLSVYPLSNFLLTRLDQFAQATATVKMGAQAEWVPDESLSNTDTLDLSVTKIAKWTITTGTPELTVTGAASGKSYEGLLLVAVSGGGPGTFATGITWVGEEPSATDGLVVGFTTIGTTILGFSGLDAAGILALLLTVDGAGSGLDADLLDGNQASAFATAGHNHASTYQPLAAVLTNTTASFTTADESKLDAIEAGAQLTNFTRVSAALAAASGAVDYNGQPITSIGDPTALDDVPRWEHTWEWRAVDTKTAAYEPVLGDAGKLLVMNGTFDFNIPDNATAAFPVGTQIGFLCISGTCNVTDDASVVVNGQSAGTASYALTNHQIAVATKIGTDTWNLSGVDLS